MNLVDPISIYIAEGNIDAHSLVEWLLANDIPSYAVEDNSGVSLFAFGTISQFHHPRVFVDKVNEDRAKALVAEYEQRKRHRKTDEDKKVITSECEECNEQSEFPASQNGTVQNCPKCHAFMDVGTSDWPEDFDFGEPET